MNEKIIELRNLHKSYEIGKNKQLEVLKNITLEVKQGEVVGIVGVSGYGKYTLLHIMGSLDHPTAGQVIYKNEDLYQYNDEVLSNIRNSNFGFVFQFHYLINELTALENIVLPAMILKNSPKNYEKGRTLLKEVGLYDRIDHYPNELSGGELQRIAIARALVNAPNIVFADEPTGELDNENSEKVFEMFLDIVKKHGTTVIFVTHNKEFAEKMDITYRLHYGKLEGI
jgi:lipoprotein-releasing system ATP-binding protein